MILLFSINLLNNPIAVPQAIISELLFHDNNDWVLEIGFAYDELYNSQDFDSICISTSNGFSKIELNNLKINDSLFVISSDSLSPSLSVNRNGDFIKLHSYLSFPFSGEVLIDSLVFGKYPGSTFDSLQIGYSICRLSYFIFSKDKSPTIGLPNDTSGTCGTIMGFIYDNNPDLVTEGNFELEYPIIFNFNGTYSTRVYSRKTVKTFIDTVIALGQIRIVPIEPLYINIDPDSIVRKDIHLLVDYSVGVKEQYVERNYKLSVINYPNPFNTITNFSIILPQSSIYQIGNIKIFNMTGQEIKNIELSTNLTAKWDGTDKSGLLLPSGIYFYQLILDNQIYKKGSLIFLK